MMADKELKSTSVNLALSALKFFFENIVKKDIFKDIKPPKIARKLPTVLTKDEVKRIIANSGSLRNKLLIELMYSSGLRVSEAVSIKFEDIDLDERMAVVREAKGRKDRNIILSDAFIEDLLKYKELCGLSSGFLFKGRKGHISTRQAQNILKLAAEQAGINRKVFCHALRSSFATHLLDSGVDIRIIQELLGHSNLQTTQIYTKVSREQLKKIKSPLDIA